LVCEYVADADQNQRAAARLANASASKTVGIVAAHPATTQGRDGTGADADLARYEIVWRDTTGAVWMNAQTVSNV